MDEYLKERNEILHLLPLSLKLFILFHECIQLSGSRSYEPCTPLTVLVLFSICAYNGIAKHQWHLKPTAALIAWQIPSLSLDLQVARSGKKPFCISDDLIHISTANLFSGVQKLDL